MKLWFRCALYAAAALPLAAQMPKEEGITRQQADEIIDELKQIRQLLERQQESKASDTADDEGPKPAKVGVQGAPMLGNKDAPLTMVEFTDFQCPYCKKFYAETFAELKKNYIDSGKMRFFSRDLPLDFHPDAMRAAEAGRCAGAQGKFWLMRDVMQANPDKLDLDSLVADAGGLNLDTKAFRDCLAGEKTKNDVQTDVMEAMKIGADGTPAFVVGKSTAEGVDGEMIVGAMPYDTFDKALKEAEAK
ncbi:MAG TPA: thioredoxin domain-containing protein [Bryobacteraceae bacterium]|nr:thioredoxin domain-containing protein [Bryobacteraceae bacterium]